VLPNAPHPLGAYVEAVQSGNLLFLSGTLPIKDGKPQYIGRLGRNSMQMLVAMLCEPRR
jgi:enamine deaminase RidA (YjgF/YER057c/UK114 family)